MWRAWCVQVLHQLGDGDTLLLLSSITAVRRNHKSVSPSYTNIKSVVFTKIVLPAGENFLFVFGGKHESGAVLGDACFLHLKQRHWAEVCLLSYIYKNTHIP